jgi:hypothetical protein
MIVMIGFVGGRVPQDSAGIVLEGYRVDRRFHGTTNENLGFHGKNIVPVDTVLGHGRVGKLCHRLTMRMATAKSARSRSRSRSRSRPRRTRPARIEWGTGRVDVGTESFFTVRGTSDIRLTRIEGDKSILLDEFVSSRGRATVTATRDVGSTIKLSKYS